MVYYIGSVYKYLLLLFTDISGSFWYILYNFRMFLRGFPVLSQLTIDNQYFDIGAVIGIMTFLTLSVVSLLTFRYSGSYKNEEEFR